MGKKKKKKKLYGHNMKTVENFVWKLSPFVKNGDKDPVFLRRKFLRLYNIESII